MNPALALERGNEAATIVDGLERLLALIGLPSKRTTGELSGSAGEIFKGITTSIDELLAQVIVARTSNEFIAARDKVFGDYARCVKALSELVSVVVPERVTERLVTESFCELEKEFTDQGIARFGAEIKDQAVFTISTLRRTSELIKRIVKFGPLKDEKAKRDDVVTALQFSYFAAWTQFHLDCLVASIRTDTTIPLEVLPEVQDGLRAAVNAYGLARSGLDLRVPPSEPEMKPIKWDEEDQELLEASMRDLEVEACLPWDPEEAKVSSERHDRHVAEIKKNLDLPKQSKPSPVFGSHIREGIDIIKDWMKNPKSAK